MTTTLLIARHGNTFEDGEEPRRVGARTDLPLVATGRKQAEALGLYLKKNNLLPNFVYSSMQKRTHETAALALATAGCTARVERLSLFNEIDYGPDENQPESEVVKRLGKEALAAWDESGIVPPGWRADPQALMNMWLSFSVQLLETKRNKTVLVVTSNGVARFSPVLAGGLDDFRKRNSLKISTGALCRFVHDGAGWTIREWNVKP